MPSIPIPQIKLGKRKERSLMAEVITDDGRWIDRELPAGNSCVYIESLGMGWLINSNQQFMAEDGNWHQILTEKSQDPIALREQTPTEVQEMESLRNGIFGATFWQKLNEGILRAHQDGAWNKVVLIISIICATMLLLGFMSWRK